MDEYELQVLDKTILMIDKSLQMISGIVGRHFARQKLKDSAGSSIKVIEEVKKMPAKYSDGSMRRRENGIIEYRFMLNGKQDQVYGWSEKEVYQLRTDKISGVYKDKKNKKAYSSAQTYGEFLDKWLEKRKNKKDPLSKSTLEGNERDLRLHITSELKKVKLKDLKPYMLEDCLNQVQTSRLRKSVYTIFSNSLRFAKANNLIKTELWKLIDTPKHIAKSRRPLEDKEYKLLLEHAEPKLKRIIIGYCWTGCRRNELLSIKYKDIKDNEITIWDQKTKKYKYVPIFPPLSKVLSKGSAEEHVFNVTSNWVNDNIRDFCDSIGLYDISPHNMRHTFGSVLYDAGVNLKDIQLWLGHSTLKMTEEIYTKRRKSTVNKEVKKIIKKMFALN